MSRVREIGLTLRRVLEPASRANRVLLLGLGSLAFVASSQTLVEVIRGFPWSVDLEIPLRAASRWMAGGQAYLPSAFAVDSGYGLPFLYPPYALPLVAPLTWLPRDPLHAAWFAVGIVLASLTVRRLGFQRRWIPFVLVWPPFSTGLIAGNVQIATFAAFVFLLQPQFPRPDPGRVDSGRSILARGLIAAATVFLKVSQAHAVVYLARREWRAASVAVALIAILVLVTLPLTGVAIWGAWAHQVQLASDPSWSAAGPSLAKFLPPPIPSLVLVGCIAAAFLAPSRDAAAWVGLLLVVGSPSVHSYYLLFLLPAMLRIRWEIGLVAALLIGFQVELGWWLALALVGATMVLSLRYRGVLRHQPAESSAA